VHHGFLPLPDSPRRLFRRKNDIEALFKMIADGHN
jgi:hypothetical protein